MPDLAARERAKPLDSEQDFTFDIEPSPRGFTANYFKDDGELFMVEELDTETGHVYSQREVDADGRGHGRSRSFWENGNLQRDTQLQHGVYGGETKLYHENGRLQCQGTVNHASRFVGDYEAYHDNGQLEEKGVRNANQLFEGLVIKGDRDGKRSYVQADGKGNEEPASAEIVQQQELLRQQEIQAVQQLKQSDLLAIFHKNQQHIIEAQKGSLQIGQKMKMEV